METLKEKAVKGFFWGAMNNMTMQILGAAFGIVLGRKLGPENYGVIGLIGVFGLVATSLQNSGFIVALINRKNATHRDFNSVFWFNVSVSICLYVLLFFCAPLIADFYDKPILVPLSRYFFLCFLVASLSIVPRAILLRDLQQKKLTIQSFVAVIISNTVGVIMAFSGMAYWGIVTQQLLFNLLVVVMSWYMSGWRPSLDITFQPVREMFRFSSKMLVTDVVERVNSNFFSVILGKYYGEISAGNYNQANKWNTMGTGIITGMVDGVAQPIFVQVGDDKERLCRTFSKMLRFTCFICFPLMFGLSLIAPEFIAITLGDEWADASYLMQILCVGGAFLPIATLYFKLIISRGKSNIYMWNVIAQLAAILSSAFFVCFFIGDVQMSILSFTLSLSAIEMMLCTYVSIVILWLFIWHTFLKREIGLPYRKALADILPFLALAAGTMVVTYIMTQSITNIYVLIASRIIIAAIIYLGALWLLGADILRECLGYVLKKT